MTFVWTQNLLDMGRAHSRPMSPLSAVGLVLHSTADPGATARQIRDYFNGHRGASTHFAVDWTEALVLIPWGLTDAEIAWHAGPTANGRFLGMECCEPAGPNSEVQFAAVYGIWVAAAADVLQTYGWPCDSRHIFSHAEISALYKETDHVDPIPFLQKWGKSWTGLMDDIATALAKVDA